MLRHNANETYLLGGDGNIALGETISNDKILSRLFFDLG